MKTNGLLAAILVALALALVPAPGAAEPATPDLDTPEGVVRELYRLVCVDAGAPTPDWDRVRDLFLPEAVIVLRVSKDASNTFTLQGWIDDFIAYNERARVSEHGFAETIVRMKPMVFRDIASILVLYEASLLDSQRSPTRGVDSIDLIRRDGRWWIVSIVNDLPNADHPLPAALTE
ncbi:MAG TPA: hypothetical protein VFX92_01985 [Candidatus Krumholzibacteria bacterium]|nr:hypothetical protein [Candidatus Krumholzibacteria bacterium]